MQKTVKEKVFKYYDGKIQNDCFYKNIIGIMNENYRKNFSEILSILSEKLKTKFTRDSLLNNIKIIKKRYGEKIYTHLINIFNYSICKQKGDIEKTREYKEKVEKYFEYEAKRKKYDKSVNNSIDHEKIIRDLNRNIDIVLEKKKTVTELYNEGLIDDNDIAAKAKRYIDEVGYEKYIDLNIINNKIYPVTKKSYDEDIYTLDFFVNNLKDTKEFLDNINLDNKTKEELEEIKEELNNIIILNIDKEETKEDRTRIIYHAKLKRVNALLNAFKYIKESIDMIKDNPDAVTFTKNSNDTFLFKIKDEDINAIKNVLSNYKNILKCRKRILNIETSDTSKIEKIKNLYDEKVLSFAKNK